eukprot:5618476-Pleurochrysis_carterae.AAC.1
MESVCKEIAAMSPGILPAVGGTFNYVRKFGVRVAWRRRRHPIRPPRPTAPRPPAYVAQGRCRLAISPPGTCSPQTTSGWARTANRRGGARPTKIMRLK